MWQGMDPGDLEDAEAFAATFQPAAAEGHGHPSEASTFPAVATVSGITKLDTLFQHSPLICTHLIQRCQVVMLIPKPHAGINTSFLICCNIDIHTFVKPLVHEGFASRLSFRECHVMS